MSKCGIVQLRRVSLYIIKIAFAVIVGFAVLLVLLQNFLIYHPVAYEDGEIEAYGRSSGVQSLPFITGEGQQEAYWIVRGGAAGVERPVFPERVWLVFSGNAALALDWVDFLFLYRGPLKCDESTALRPRLAVLGQSLGAAAGLQAAVHYNANRVVLVAPFTSMLDMARRTAGPLHCHLLRHRWDNVARMKELVHSVKSPRVSIFHGIDDTIIPVTMSQALAEPYPSFVDLKELPGLGHNDITYGASEIIIEALGK